MRKIKNVLALAVAVGAFMLTSTPAQATILAGEFATDGDNAGVRVYIDRIDFGEFGDVFGTLIGDVEFSSGSGDFAVLNGTGGEIKDLFAAAQPTGIPFVLNNFLTAASQPTWNFVLTDIDPGIGTLAGCNNVAGSLCTPTGSPFTILNLSTDSSSVTLRMHGYVTDGSGDPVSPMDIIFTTQLEMTSAQALAAILANGGTGFVESANSGQWTVTAGQIPEPSTYGLIGTGLLAIGMGARRRRK